MRYTLTAKVDEEITGELGWFPEHASSSYWPTTDALLLAHDLLEHTSLRDVEDEARALGAIYFGRFESGYVSPSRGQYGRSLELRDLSSDFSFSLWQPSRENGISYLREQRRLDSYIESDLEEIIQQGKKSVREEYPDADDLDELPNLGNIVANYFRQGYRRAHRRYGSRNRLTYLFYHLEDQFSKGWNKPEYKGQRIVCDIPFRNGDISLRYVEDEVPY